jgi:hypothetical protein
VVEHGELCRNAFEHVHDPCACGRSESVDDQSLLTRACTVYCAVQTLHWGVGDPSVTFLSFILLGNNSSGEAKCFDNINSNHMLFVCSNDGRSYL